MQTQAPQPGDRGHRAQIAGDDLVFVEQEGSLQTIQRGRPGIQNVDLGMAHG